MKYYPQTNHKFFAVFKNECNALQGYTHKKRLLNWLEEQTITSPLDLEIVDRKTLIERGQKEVTVIALFTQKEVKIRAKDLGGCCDPSTERYYSM